ncbi:MAG TPA: universal stress protein [Kofleriaceae bacterium]|nr:universal stress protein [Kofleriaceae bacterium]
MTTPTRILVPVDFSPNSEHALDYAVNLASRLDATVHVLNVIGIPTLGVPELGVAVTSGVIDSIVRENQDAVDKLVAARKTKAKLADGILRTGDPRDTILQVAAEIGADLIVMGTHGRRGLTRALVGSVAEAIVRTSPVPVLTLRQPK